jgi:hypothetical protein
MLELTDDVSNVLLALPQQVQDFINKLQDDRLVATLCALRIVMFIDISAQYIPFLHIMSKATHAYLQLLSSQS